MVRGPGPAEPGVHGLLSGPRPGTLDEPRPALQVPPQSLENYVVSITESQIWDRWLQRLAIILQPQVWSLKNLLVHRGSQISTETH